jgi:hypothetical protein
MKLKILLTMIVALFSSAVLAGLHQPAPITIDLDNRIASGDMLTAANSVNSDEFIGCGTRSFDDGLGNAFRFGFCQVQEKGGESITCFTESEALLDEMRASNDFSFVTFSWTDDGAGNLTCTRVGFSTQSFYLDKVKN